jgi:hypothetical protein
MMENGAEPWIIQIKISIHGTISKILRLLQTAMCSNCIMPVYPLKPKKWLESELGIRNLGFWIGSGLFLNRWTHVDKKSRAGLRAAGRAAGRRPRAGPGRGLQNVVHRQLWVQGYQ